MCLCSEGVEEVEEVREVQGELYRRVSVSEHVNVTPVTDTLSGATDLVTLRYFVSR